MHRHRNHRQWIASEGDDSRSLMTVVAMRPGGRNEDQRLMMWAGFPTSHPNRSTRRIHARSVQWGIAINSIAAELICQRWHS